MQFCKISEERLILEQKRKELYKYYGIPYDIFDDNSNKDSQVEKDRDIAMLLIIEGKHIPKDLEERLLIYKENDKVRNNV